MKPLLMLFLMRVGLPFSGVSPPRAAIQGDPFSVRDYIGTLQKDGRLLLRHLARRSDIALPEMTTVGAVADETSADVLFEPVEWVLGNPAKTAEVIHGVDVLSRRAAPANVRSIRLTAAYLKMTAEGGEPSPDIKSEARQIHTHINSLAGLAILIFLIAVELLIHADYGRRLLLQVEVLRNQQSEVQAALSALPQSEFEARPLAVAAAPQRKGNKPVAAPQRPPATAYKGPFCPPEKPELNGPWLQPVTAKAIDLCRQAADVRPRISLLGVALADWNCWNYKLNPLNGISAWQDPLSCDEPTRKLRDGLTDDDWRSYETRVSASIAVMAGFVLPMMLGFLGGCAYVFRHFDLKLASWTLEPHDGKHAWVRVLLAALLGGLVGVIWTSDTSVSLGGLTLSLAATAFFVGFSVEAVFRLIQTLTDGVVSTIRPPGSLALVTASPISPTQVRRIAEAAAATPGTPDTTNSADRPGNSAAGPPQTRQSLSDLSEKLDTQRQVLGALVQLKTGSPVAADAPAVITAIDSTLQTIRPILNGKADVAGLGAAALQAGKTLALAENSGLPGILADGVATLKGVADFAGPVLAGIPAGPIGIIGGIVLGGLQLFENEQKFQALKAALLRKPFDPGFRLRVPDGPTALAALDASPLMSARVPTPKDSAFAMQLMQTLLEQDPSGAVKSATDLAVLLLRPGGPLGLDGHFASPTELAMAIEEYRSGVVFTEASKRLDGSVEIPDPDTGSKRSLNLQDLARAALELHVNPRASAAIENTMALTEALAKLPLGRQATIDLVTQALGQVTSIVSSSRQVKTP